MLRSQFGRYPPYLYANNFYALFFCRFQINYVSLQSRTALTIMEPVKRKYPVGIQTFSEIIREGYLYVDKTDLV